MKLQLAIAVFQQDSRTNPFTTAHLSFDERIVICPWPTHCDRAKNARLCGRHVPGMPQFSVPGVLKGLVK